MKCKSENATPYKVTPIKPVDDAFIDDEIIKKALAILENRMTSGMTLCSPKESGDYLRVKYAQLDHEVFGVIFLDNHHKILSCEEMFRGTLNGAAVYHREIVKRALAVNAASVMLFHNHPSGIAEPSRADEALTASLVTALKTVDIRVLDHLVVGLGGVVSFAERGLI